MCGPWVRDCKERKDGVTERDDPEESFRYEGLFRGFIFSPQSLPFPLPSSNL